MNAEPLVAQLKHGLDAPICLTWELTYACNLQCVHCLSSSGVRDPHELSTAEAKSVLDQLAALQVFYINIGGGEPMVRRDFFELLDYSIDKGIGVKFSTNGVFIDEAKAQRLAAMDYLDIQISLDGVDAATNDPVRGVGSYASARRAMDNLAAAGFGPFKISVVATRHNIPQLDEFKALADSLRRPAARHPPAPERPRRRLVGRPAPHRRAAAGDLRLADAPRRRRAHRRLVLPPQRVRRVAARASTCAAPGASCA